MIAAEYQPTAVQALIDAKSDLTATAKRVSICDVLCVYLIIVVFSRHTKHAIYICFDMTMSMLYDVI